MTLAEISHSYLKSNERDRMCKQLTMVEESLPVKLEIIMSVSRAAPQAN